MHNPIIIEPERGWLRIGIKELYQYRELIGFMAWRNIAAVYKQAFFGVSWAITKPVFSVLLYTLVFGKIANLSTSGIPYPLFTFCGVIAWDLFASSLSQSTLSLIGNTSLVTKVYFPRLIIPIASLGRGIVDFIISIFLIAILMSIYRITPMITIIYFPIFLLMGLCITLGIGLLFAALSVKYRDIRHAVPFVIQMWFWITPIAYGIENIPEKFVHFYYFNPMTWIIQGFRWSLLGVGEMDIKKLLISGLISILVFVLGLCYFRKMENDFADII